MDIFEQKIPRAEQRAIMWAQLVQQRVDPCWALNVIGRKNTYALLILIAL